MAARTSCARETPRRPRKASSAFRSSSGMSIKVLMHSPSDIHIRYHRGTVVARMAGRRLYARASSTMLNGPSVARRMRLKPPSRMTSESFASPAWAPRPSPTSWSSEVGTQIIVEAL